MASAAAFASPQGRPQALASTTNREIFLANRDLENTANMREETIKVRPKNTTLNYVPKQQEFINWTREMGYTDGDTVTEAKMMSFLTDKVVHRPLRRKKKKKNAVTVVDKESGQPTQVLKWGSVRTYVTAITDLYNTQYLRKMNSNPSPRAAGIRDYIKSLQRRDTALDKLNFVDKGQGTYLDSYTEAKFKELCVVSWKDSSKPSHNAVQSLCYLRTLVDQLLGHFLLARGEDRRSAEISDLHTFEFPDQGITPCFPLILTVNGSKTNQFGRLETMGAFRNRDPLVCPLGALGFYLLFRWDLTEEPFPDFKDRSSWYNIRLLLSAKDHQDVTAELSYSTQLEWISKLFSLIGLCTTKKTHLFRAAGAKMAELLGVKEDQISRAGRWIYSQMIGCYLTSLPLDFMRRMAGFFGIGSFEIKRAIITPPDELLTLIWPELDQWKGKFGTNDGQIDDLAAGGSALCYINYVRSFCKTPLR